MLFFLLKILEEKTKKVISVFFFNWEISEQRGNCFYYFAEK